MMNEIFIIFPMRATYPAYSASSDLFSGTNKII